MSLSRRHIELLKRKTHCKRGHALSGDNLYVYRGSRNCKECKAQRCRDYRAGKPSPTFPEMFWARVTKTASCWLWDKPWNRGYGAFSYQGRRRRAHRVAWQITYGPIPEGLLVCHHCDTPLCVRPDHLFLGTDADNATDKALKGRSTAKLTAAQVIEIRSSGETNSRIAKRVGISSSAVRRARCGRTYKHVVSV